MNMLDIDLSAERGPILLFFKADGGIKNSPGMILYGNPPRWHKFSAEKHTDPAQTHYHAKKLYEVKAAQKAAADPGHKTSDAAPEDHIAAMKQHAGEAQAKASASAAVTGWKQALMAGKPPAAAQQKAMLDLAVSNPDKAIAVAKEVSDAIGPEKMTALLEAAKSGTKAPKPAAPAAPKAEAKPKAAAPAPAAGAPKTPTTMTDSGVVQLKAADASTFVKDSVVKTPVYHFASPEFTKTLAEGGMKVSDYKSKAWNGQAIYFTPMGQQGAIGSSKVKAYINVQNPYKGTVKEHEAQIEQWMKDNPLPGGAEYTPEQQAKLARKKLLEAGYDSVILSDDTWEAVAVLNSASIGVVERDDKPVVGAPAPAPEAKPKMGDVLWSEKGADNMIALVVQGSHGMFNAVLKDGDSGNTVGMQNYSTQDAATAKAKAWLKGKADAPAAPASAAAAPGSMSWGDAKAEFHSFMDGLLPHQEYDTIEDLDLHPDLKAVPEKAALAALAAFSKGAFAELNEDPDHFASKALLGFIKKLKPETGLDKIHRVVAFGSPDEAKAFVAELGGSAKAPFEQKRTLSSWTTHDPAAPGQTPMNNIALDLASQFGDNRVFMSLEQPKEARDVSFIYGKSTKKGLEQVLAQGVALDVVSTETKGKDTHVTLREVHEGDTKSINGKTYILQNGRWHLQGGADAPAASAAAPASEPAAPKQAPATAAVFGAKKPAQPQKPKQILHNTQDGHSKSWSVYVTPNDSGGFDMVTEYGKIGGTQQKSVKTFGSQFAAEKAANKLKAQKKAKGYDHHDYVSAPKPAAAQAQAAPKPAYTMTDGVSAIGAFDQSVKHFTTAAGAQKILDDGGLKVSHGVLDNGVYFVDGDHAESSAAGSDAAVDVPIKKAKLLEFDSVEALTKFVSTNQLTGALDKEIVKLGFDGIRVKKPYTAGASPWVVIYNTKVLGTPKAAAPAPASPPDDVTPEQEASLVEWISEGADYPIGGLKRIYDSLSSTQKDYLFDKAKTLTYAKNGIKALSAGHTPSKSEANALRKLSADKKWDMMSQAAISLSLTYAPLSGPSDAVVAAQQKAVAKVEELYQKALGNDPTPAPAPAQAAKARPEDHPTIDGWKESLLNGKPPTIAQQKAKVALMESDYDAYAALAQTVIGVMGVNAYVELTAPYSAYGDAGDDPKEGDTKTVNGVTYQLINGRWHKVGGENLNAAKHQLINEVHAQKLPDTNSNAATVNKKLDKLAGMIDAEDIAGMQAAKWGSNNYGKKIAKKAAEAVAKLQSIIGGGAPAAAPSAPAQAATAGPAPVAKPQSSAKAIDGWVDAVSKGEQPTAAQAAVITSLAANDVDAYLEVLQEAAVTLAQDYYAPGADDDEIQAAHSKAVEKILGIQNAVMDASAQAAQAAAAAPAAPAQAAAPDEAVVQGWIGALSEGKSPTPEQTKAMSALALSDNDAYMEAMHEAANNLAMEYAAGATDDDEIEAAQESALTMIENILGVAEDAANEASDPDGPTVAGWKASLLAGKAPTIAQVKAKLSYMNADMEAGLDLENEVISAVGAAKIEAILAPYKDVTIAGDDPKEGDTKIVNGTMYQLINGRWHKMGDVQKAVTGWVEALSEGKHPTLAQAQIVAGLDPDDYMETLQEAAINLAQDYYSAGAGDDEIEEAHDKALTMVTSIQHQVLGIGRFAGAAPTVAVFKPGAASTVPEAIDGWSEQPGTQKGSNPGGVYTDADGQKWYVKFPKSEDHVKNEFLAAQLYKAAGIAAPDLKMVTKGGQAGIASKWKDGLTKVGAGIKNADGALDGFAVDAWLGNYDSVGTGYDNLLQDADGKAVRIDVGGALLYRAQGAKKTDFGNKVTELQSMVDPSKNTYGHAVFGSATPEHLKAGVTKIAAISEADIENLVEQFGPGGPAAKVTLANKLIARRKDLLKQFPDVIPAKAAPKKAAKAPPVFDPAKLSTPPDFMHWTSAGAPGPSGVLAVNQANQDATQAIYAAAKTGDPEAVKAVKGALIDKATGEKSGETSVLTHPSQHISGFAQQMLNEIHEQMNPPKEFEWDTNRPLAEIDKGAPIEQQVSKPGLEKVGYFVVLSKPGKVAGLKSLLDAEPLTFKKGKVTQKTYSAVMQDTFPKIPITQLSAIQSYTGGGYEEINSSLWSGNPSGKAKAAKEAMHTHSHDVKIGTVLSRKFSLHGADMAAFMKSAGHVLQEPAMVSTSLSPDTWSGNIHLKLHVGPGVKGMYVGVGSKPDGYAISSHPGEKEVLLPPNTRLYVVSVKQAGGGDEDGYGHGSSVVAECIILPTQD